MIKIKWHEFEKEIDYFDDSVFSNSKLRSGRHSYRLDGNIYQADFKIHRSKSIVIIEYTRSRLNDYVGNEIGELSVKLALQSSDWGVEWNGKNQAKHFTVKKLQGGREHLEGGVRLATHKRHERSSNFEALKSEKILKLGGAECQICNYTFTKDYAPDIASGFIEGHHINLVSRREKLSKTNLKDILLLCSNCHRMAHRYISLYPEKERWNSLSKLKKGIRSF